MREPLKKLLSRQDLALLRLMARTARTLGMSLYVVGGLARDVLLDRPSRDLDLVVEGDAVALARSLAAAHGGSVVVHRRFGTASWRREAPAPGPNESASALLSGSFDLVTARSEIYAHPAELPRVSPGTIDDDLRRRDFTINAIAIRLDGAHFGRVLDPLGGVADVRARRVRVLHQRSFVDDPTRIFRAVRYEQRLGFRISRETRELIQAGGRWVGRLSGQRLRHELDLILRERNAPAMLKRLAGLGMLRRAHRLLTVDSGRLRRIAAVEHADGEGVPVHRESSAAFARWIVWLMDLSPAGVRSVGRRLAFSGKELSSLVAAARLYQSAATWVLWRPSQLALMLDAIPRPALQATMMALPAGRKRLALDDYLRSWRHARPNTTGRDLLARGLKPGPQFRSILRSLRAAWIDGAIQDAEGERALLDRLLGKSIPLRVKAPRRKSIQTSQ